jgi:hypothetical protein
MQEESGNDLHKYFELIRESEERHKKDGWKYADEVPQHKKAACV